MQDTSFDLLTFGRASIDLYSKDIGAEFNDIKELSTSIGGSPVNIAVGARRLGIQSALFSAVAPDPVGEFIVSTLQKEKVDTTHVQNINGTTSTAVICGILPPDRFPLVFYRDNAPDKKISIDHVNEVDFTQYKIFLMSGTALAVDPSRSAAFYATEQAKKAGATIFLDVDFRAISWHDIRAFGVVLRQYLSLCNVVIGTEEELMAMFLQNSEQLTIKDSSITAPEIQGDADQAIQMVLDQGVELLLVKAGAQGVTAYHQSGKIEKIPGFSVEVINILGAGDAFASGFIYGYVNQWDTYKTGRLANACGAWLVTKQGCCNCAPYYDQIIKFIEEKGGF